MTTNPIVLAEKIIEVIDSLAIDVEKVQKFNSGQFTISMENFIALGGDISDEYIKEFSRYMQDEKAYMAITNDEESYVKIMPLATYLSGSVLFSDSDTFKPIREFLQKQVEIKVVEVGKKGARELNDEEAEQFKRIVFLEMVEHTVCAFLEDTHGGKSGFLEPIGKLPTEKKDWN